ncbi:ricin B-like lectin R40C1 [Carex rostrata]
MGESKDPIYRIICRYNTDYSLAIRGENVVFALTHPFDRSQHWMKDERHGDIKDSEDQPAFALVNRATGKAISHGPNSQPMSLVQYNANSCHKSVLWSMSKDVYEGFRIIRRVDDISICFKSRVEKYCPLHEGHLIDLSVLPGKGFLSVVCHWKVENISPSTCIPLFKPSQHTVKIICQAKQGYNLAIDTDGSTVLSVPSNPKDKYQYWIKETAYGVPVKDEKGQEAFALVNKATGKAIKHGFGYNYLVQVSPFNRNYLDPSLLWTESSGVSHGFQQIRMQNSIDISFDIFNKGIGDSPLLGLSKSESGAHKNWKIEDFE